MVSCQVSSLPTHAALLAVIPQRWSHKFPTEFIGTSDSFMFWWILWPSLMWPIPCFDTCRWVLWSSPARYASQLQLLCVPAMEQQAMLFRPSLPHGQVPWPCPDVPSGFSPVNYFFSAFSPIRECNGPDHGRPQKSFFLC